MNPGLVQHSDNIFSAAYPLKFMGLHFGTRMGLARTNEGRLLVYSPVPLNEKLKSEIDALGEVGCIVAPNLFHHLFAGEYKEAWPDARLIAAPCLSKKRKDLAPLIDEELAADSEFEGCKLFAMPGMPALAEIVLYHAGDRALFVCDLLSNFTGSSHWFTLLYLKLMASTTHPAVSKAVRLAFKDRSAVRTGLERLWHLELATIVLAHGEVLSNDSQEPGALNDAFRQAYDWL